MSKFSTESAQKLSELESHLANNSFVGGEQPSQEDTAVFSSLKSVPDRKKYPNLYFYYCTLCNFTQGAIQGFKGEAKAEKKEEKKEEKKVEKKKEDDDIDLFGDDNEEDKAALAKVAEKQKAEQEKKKEKKVVIAKSIIVFDVKVYDTEQDLKALAEKIFKEVNMDGLVWNKDVKIVPIAFGMNKLQVGCVVEDAKVGTDDIFEKIQEWEDEVQSCDIVTFQKL